MTILASRFVRVGVIDSGWMSGSTDSRVDPGQGFCLCRSPFDVYVSGDYRDLIGHGTACAQIILTMAPTARVTPLRVFFDTLETSPAVLCASLDWAATQRFDVVSLSLSTAREDARDALYALCERLRRDGTIVVAAARNGTHSGYPAVFDNVVGVTVGAADVSTEAVCDTANGVEIVVDQDWRIPVTCAGGSPTLLSTSFATAFVAGVIADCLSKTGPLSLERLRGHIKDKWPEHSIVRYTSGC